MSRGADRPSGLSCRAWIWKSACEEPAATKPCTKNFCWNSWADHQNDHQKVAEAIKRSDLDEALLVSHSLKGVAGGLGAGSLYESARDMESSIKERQSEKFEPLLERLTRDLTEVIDELKIKMPVPGDGTDHAAAESVDIEKALSLLDEFRKLAEDFDPEAEQKAEEINRLVKHLGNDYKNLGERLAAQAANLDFDEALVTAEELYDSLGR